MSNPNVAFTLRIRLVPPGHGKIVTITAYDGGDPSEMRGWRGGWDIAGRVKLTVEVKHGSEVIFPAGQLHCALHGASDGIEARELVMSLVAMRPGNTDRDYFGGWRCKTCHRLGTGAAPAACPSCCSDHDDDHGPHAIPGSYTERQLAWVTEHGEALSMEREARYCDPETGSVRRTA